VRLRGVAQRQPIWEFYACVFKHCATRELSLETAYWICAYANRQHCLGGDVTVDPKQSSFFKAIELSEGILLILDSRKETSGPATPFTRIWCDFEESLAVDGTLDIATFSFNTGEDVLGEDPIDAVRCKRPECPFLRGPHNTYGYCCGGCKGFPGGKRHGACTYEHADRIACITPGCKLLPNKGLMVRGVCCTGCQAGTGCKKEIGDGDGAKCTGKLAREPEWTDDVKEPTLLTLAERGKPALITHGTLPQDGRAYPLLKKAKRERNFPLDVIKAGLSVEVQRGQASMPEDRVHILNSIAGQPLENEPLLEHENYEAVNRKLRSKFAFAVLPMALRAGVHDDLALFEKIGGDTSKTELVLELTGAPNLKDTSTLQHAFSGDNLQSVKLNLNRCHLLCDLEGLRAGLRRVTTVCTFEADFGDCKLLSDIKPLGFGLAGMAGLKNLTLHFVGCDHLSKVEGLFDCLAKIHNLEVLKMNLAGSISGITGLGAALASSKQLHQVELLLGGHTTAWVDEIASGIAGLERLSRFSLHCNGHEPTVAPIARALCNKKDIHISMSLSSNSQLEGAYEHMRNWTPRRAQMWLPKYPGNWCFEFSKLLEIAKDMSNAEVKEDSASAAPSSGFVTAGVTNLGRGLVSLFRG